MRRAFLSISVLLCLSVLLSACGAPPPLKSDKYLKDTSLLDTGVDACTPPCFHKIIVGKTTFPDALGIVKADAAFANVQSQDKPPQAAWSAKDGDACCQMQADANTGIVNAIVIKVAPTMTVKQVIDKYGAPKYVTPVDYTPQEVALGLVFPTVGLVTWVTPGDPTSTLKESDPVVILLYLDPAQFNDLLATSTLQGWNGYLPYQVYKTATPVVTPRITVTPGSQ